ncbi:MAG TPA: putative metal-binding motif-containing protein [Polyangiaceae bacterium]|nr:putative metal-binding motif-containing protein [Polyangiaceae bacterium]
MTPTRRARARATRTVQAALGIAALCTLLAPATAVARSAGVAALGCENCHSGGKAPTVTLTADPPHPAVGELVTLTISVSQANGSAAGFYLTTAYNVPGAFKTAESGTSASGSGVLHTAPRSGSGGVTTFKAQWSTSQATGVAFDVFALSANGDKTNRGDGAGVAHLQLAVGCAGLTYYIDQDGDGYGSTDPVYQTRVDCTPPPSYAAMPGDCDDFHAPVHPGAVEQCDMKDNDCNGEVDDDVVYQDFCQDQDGDGHGVRDAATKMDCKPSPGFGACDDDCDDRDPNVHPDATEDCDGRDDNCNGKTDEGAQQACGVGLCARYAVGCSNNCTPGEPFGETCDGYDDDCDGEVDEGTNETLCGDANVPCVSGRCLGAVGGGSGAGSGASSGSSSGGSSAGGSASGLPPGLSGPAGSRGGCALTPKAGRDRALGWLLMGALLLRTRRRQRR